MSFISEFKTLEILDVSETKAFESLTNDKWREVKWICLLVLLQPWTANAFDEI